MTGGAESVGSSVDPREGLVLGGRYRLGQRVGVGGMGVVYEALQETLGRRVAVKCMHPHLASSADFIARFMSEARLASRLSHPHVVRVYDFGTEETKDGPLPYLVMELCSGKQLGDVLSERAWIPLARVATIMGQVLSALGEAHAHGIIHRDVKPENVILEAGARGVEVVKLIDFGIAEATVDGPRASRAIAGTPAYLAPEVIRGEAVDHHADLYAAGAMLFELLTGRPLFEGDDVNAVLEQQLRAPRPDPRAVAPDRYISAELAEICMRSVAIEQRERFEDAEALAEALALAIVTPISHAPRSRTSERSSSRPPLYAGSERRSLSPAGRYSLRLDNEDRVSGVHVKKERALGFWRLQELEHEATTAMTKRRWGEAINRLRIGLDAAVALVNSGELELGSAAITAFGRRLGEALRKDERPAEAMVVLRAALLHAPKGELSRALLLEELGLNAARMDSVSDAFGAWLDAADVARECDNPVVEQRLLRRIGATVAPRNRATTVTCR